MSSDGAAGRRGRPRKQDVQHLDARLLDLTWTIFVEHGYDGLTMEALSDAAHSSKRTIYARFSSKEVLFEAAFGRSFARWSDLTDARLEDGRPDAWIERFVDQSLQMLLTPEIIAVMRFMFGPGVSLPFVAAFGERFFDNSVTRISAVAAKDPRINQSHEDLHLAARCALNLIIGHAQTFRFATMTPAETYSHLSAWRCSLVRMIERMFSVRR